MGATTVAAGSDAAAGESRLPGGTAGMSDIAAEYRRCVGAFTTGVTVVTACDRQVRAGMTLNSFTSLSLEPLLICVALARGARTLQIIRRDGRFGISVLHAGQRDVARAFATPGAEFPDHHVESYVDGYLLVSGALAMLRCDLDRLVTVGDHELVIGHVLDFEHNPGEPLVFHRGEFGGLDPGLAEIACRARPRERRRG